MRVDTDAPQLHRRHIYQFIYKHRTFIDLINCETVQIYDNDVKTAHTIHPTVYISLNRGDVTSVRHDSAKSKSATRANKKVLLRLP